MKKILVQFAHPALEKSRVNRVLLEAISNLPNVTINDLYELYPDFDIDIDREQELLLQHDVVILQHPFYWYSAPAIIKQWIDLVLEHGWAYGRSGTALTGKQMLNALTTGGRQEAYQPTGSNRYTIAQFLAPFEQTARLCKMVYLPPFVIHGTHRMEEETVRDMAQQYRHLVTLLSSGSLDGADIQQFAYLNELSTNQKSV